MAFDVAASYTSGGKARACSIRSRAFSFALFNGDLRERHMMR